MSFLSKYRIKYNLTQKKLGESFKVHQVYVSQLEKGKKNPSFKLLQNMSVLLNISTFEMFKLLYCEYCDIKCFQPIKFDRNSIKSLRKINDITQKELAEALNVKQSYISKIENNNKKPSINFILKLSNYFKICPAIIFEYFYIKVTDSE